MISKELLSEVFSMKINIIEFDKDRNLIHYYCNQFGKATGHINIYELAHKCKEWALSKGYELHSYTHYDDSISYINVWHWDSLHKDVSDIQLKDNTEPEAIFKACQWILKNKDKK